MRSRAGLIAFRLCFGLLTLSALGVQLAIQLRNGFSIVNFFSFFTNLSNILAALLFVGGAGWMAAQRSAPAASDPAMRDPDMRDTLRGASTMNMVVVALVYAALLRNADLGALRPWVNTVLHGIMPVAVVVEWLYQPPRTPLGIRDLLRWEIFPLCYLVYTLTRGAVVGWYPYPFLNPAAAGGYGAVALYGCGILVTFLLVGWAVMASGNLRRRQTVAAASRRGLAASTSAAST